MLPERERKVCVWCLCVDLPLEVDGVGPRVRLFPVLVRIGSAAKVAHGLVANLESEDCEPENVSAWHVDRDERSGTHGRPLRRRSRAVWHGGVRLGALTVRPSAGGPCTAPPASWGRRPREAEAS